MTVFISFPSTLQSWCISRVWTCHTCFIFSSTLGFHLNISSLNWWEMDVALTFSPLTLSAGRKHTSWPPFLLFSSEVCNVTRRRGHQKSGSDNAFQIDSVKSGKLKTTWHFPALGPYLFLYIFLHRSVSAASKCPTPGMQTAGPLLFMSCIVASVAWQSLMGPCVWKGYTDYFNSTYFFIYNFI